MSLEPISTDPARALSQGVGAAHHGSVADPAPDGESVRRDAVPSSPPQEVFAAMLTAAQSADRLAAAGRALRFDTDETTGLSVRLTDLDGTVLRTLAPSTVLSVASGGALD